MERDIRTIDIGTLGDLVDGRPGRQFSAAFRDVIAAVVDTEAKRNGSGIAKGSVTITVDVEGTSTENGAHCSVFVNIATKTPAAKKSSAQLVQVGPDSYGVDLTDTQTRMFGRIAVVE